ncbi:MAG: nucleotidyl transferase AbiEii/AbiGii toxin family protein [Spirochaetales bacterium]|nr:nucleotidyl transferase AbiEii/AbiGii toxin family protein [Spirochaetales bacterium]
MTTKFPDNPTQDSLVLWLIHRIAEEFRESAIIKGGIALQLLSCPRATNDLDYVFVPFQNKKQVLPVLVKIVREIPGAELTKSLHSKGLRINIEVNTIRFQIEANVSEECRSIPVSTEVLARKLNEMGRIVRIMDLDTALSHKLAAWNERRLYRDLYDVYFLVEAAGALPDRAVLDERLKKIESRIPALSKIKSMTMDDFLLQLEKEKGELAMEKLTEQLEPILSSDNLVALDTRIKVALSKVIQGLRFGLLPIFC